MMMKCDLAAGDSAAGLRLTSDYDSTSVLLERVE